MTNLEISLIVALVVAVALIGFVGYLAFIFLRGVIAANESYESLKVNYAMLAQATGLDVHGFDDHRGRRVVYKGNGRLEEVIVNKVITSTPNTVMVEVDNVVSPKFNHGY